MVLSIFPLAATFEAALFLAEHLATGRPVASTPIEPDIGLWLPLIFGVVEALLALSVVFLVWYLLVRSDQGLRSINLSRRRWRTDLALLLPLFLVVFVAPQWLGVGIMGWADIHPYVIYGVPLPTEWANVLTWCARGLQSGIVEEIVVLGYLVRRLEQRGWHWGWIVVADVAVRVSYHVYYGPGVIPIALWATVSVLIYLRIRRLLPFILAHVAYDVGLEVRGAYHDLYLGLAIGGFVLGLVASALWARWAPSVSPDGALLTALAEQPRPVSS
jgi:membrane protease YdiL (CAAX protease family)